MVKTELHFTSYELRVRKLYLLVESLKTRAEIQKSELKFTSCEFKSSSSNS